MQSIGSICKNSEVCLAFLIITMFMPYRYLCDTFSVLHKTCRNATMLNAMALMEISTDVERILLHYLPQDR